jgi:Zn-dependent protease with chaperone function
MRHLGWVVLFIPLIALGCSTAVGPSDLWLQQSGGVALGDCQARTQRVGQVLIDHCQGRVIALRVLQNDTLGACAWPDGHIYVTQALANRLTDGELAATIAHELGHLVNDGRVQAMCSLSGTGSGPDVEVRADATGTDLLIACGIPPQNMITMLQKVAKGGSLPEPTQLAMAHRIEILQARLNQPATGE